MSGFAIAIDYLTGYAVATDHVDRDQPEWPPHPARVFMALAAAHFETGADSAERLALQWLESLEQPAMIVPRESVRQTVTVYVPVNDATGIDMLPTRRSRQPRSFPRVFVGDATLRLIWQGVHGAPEHLDALERLCSKVTRIGHSSSMVWVRLEQKAEDLFPTHLPDEHAIGIRLRTPSEGTVDRLKAFLNSDAVLEHAELAMRGSGIGPQTKARGKGSAGEPVPGRHPFLTPAYDFHFHRLLHCTPTQRARRETFLLRSRDYRSSPN